jgi:acyl carrier protein
LLENSLNEEVVLKKLKDFITSELINDGSYPLTRDEPIITGGLIDSFALAELAVFIEEQFEIYIPNPDLTVEKMDTLAQIVKRVMQDI